MSNFDNTNKGTIAKNTRKEADNHPDITGSLNVNGVEHWINGWLKTNSRDGSKFYSLSIKPKECGQVPSRIPAKSYGDEKGRYSAPADDDDQDTIPF
jgi:hypothetical protein